MSNDHPQTHSTSPTTSTKDIKIHVDPESNSSNMPTVNFAKFSKSAIVIKPSNIKALSGDIPQNVHLKKIPTQKNNANLHTLSTKYGSLVFPETKKPKKKVIAKSKGEEIVIVKQASITAQPTNITLSDIAENPTLQNIEYIFRKPVFLRCLVNDGKIDQNCIHSIIQNITKNDLYAFMNAMTMELTLYSTLSASYNLADIEKNLVKLLLFKKVIVWYKPYNSNFLISPTLKEALPLSRSIIGYCALRMKKVITNDPAMSPGFDIDNDLPILRGAESMAIYPVISDYGDVSGIVQFIDLQNQNKTFIVSISKYEQSLLKLVVKIVKRQIFKDEDSSAYVPKELIQLLLVCRSGKVNSAITKKTTILSDQKKMRPSTSKNFSPGKSNSSFDLGSISQNNSKNELDEQIEERNLNNFDIDDNFYYNVSFSFENIILNMIIFLKKYFDCDGVDIFEFNIKKKRFIRLSDGVEFSESSVGLSFLPIIKEEPVFVANGLHMGFPRSNIDKKYANNSALTVAYKYRYKIINDDEKTITKMTESKIKFEIESLSNDQNNKNDVNKSENDNNNLKEEKNKDKLNSSELNEKSDSTNEAKETNQNNEAIQENRNMAPQEKEVIEEKTDNETKKEETKQEKTDDKTQEKDESKQEKADNENQKEEIKQEKAEDKTQKEETKQEKTDDKTQEKDEVKREKADNENQKEEIKQEKADDKTRKDYETQNEDENKQKEMNKNEKNNSQCDIQAPNESKIENEFINLNENDFNYQNEEESNESDPSIATSQYVFTLRSKWMLPSFLPDDLKKLNDISMILCACIHNAQINRSQNAEIKKLQRENFLIQVLGSALTNYIDRREDKWSVLRKAAKEIFGATTCFVCSFDGKFIHFHPTDVTCKFDECIAGKAFNFQELAEFIPDEKEKKKEKEKKVRFSLDDKVNQKDENEIDDLEIYEKLGVAEDLKRASAFHFLDDGKVKGSIELINPTYPEIDIAGQNIIGIICSIINPF